MLLFWSLVALMLAAALAIVLAPLLTARAPASGSVSDAQAAIDAHRARAAALDEQLAHGSLDEPSYRQAMDELERQVLIDAQAREARADGTRRARVTAAVVAIALPLLCLAVYWQVGGAGALTILNDAEQLHRLSAQSDPDPAAMQRMADNLRLRLDADGNDLNGWRLLARTRMSLSQYDRAVDALERALALAGDDPQVLIDSVEALSMANEMRFSPLAQTRIERALSMTPEHPKGLMLGALAALQRGDTERGLNRLRRLQAEHPPGSQRRAFLDQLIAQVRQSASSETQATASRARVIVDVSVADELKPSVQPDQRVFVFARRAQGPPMPLAATSLRAGALPSTIVLDDSMGMIAGNTLSSAKRIVVGVRVSTTGSATPTSGDLEGLSQPLTLDGEARAQVVIRSRRP